MWWFLWQCVVVSVSAKLVHALGVSQEACVVTHIPVQVTKGNSSELLGVHS